MRSNAVRIEAEQTSHEAFGDVYRQHFVHVWHTLRRYGVRERDLEDVAHDTFIVAHQRLHTFDRERPIRPWLSGIAWRMASDYRRRARYRLEVVGHAKEPMSGQRGPEAAAITSQAQRQVAVALEELSEEQRVVFIMKEIDGFSVPEIAEALELPLNTLYSRLRLGRARFRQVVLSKSSEGDE